MTFPSANLHPAPETNGFHSLSGTGTENIYTMFDVVNSRDVDLAYFWPNQAILQLFTIALIPHKTAIQLCSKLIFLQLTKLNISTIT